MQWKKSGEYNEKLWLNDAWPKQTIKLKQLIDKFKPVPGWHTSLEHVRVNRHIQEKYRLGHAQKKYPVKIKGLNRDGLCDLYKALGYKTGCEIGVARGAFSKIMLERIPGLKLYCIDQWKDYEGQRKKRKHHKNYKFKYT